ncbi:MAG: DNA polymerase I [Succinivibrio sp.]
MAENFPLVLVDGSSFLYRAFYASKQSFTNSKGVPTGVSLIITNMLNSLLKKFDGSKFIVVFDAKGKSFRHQMYEEYKANRAKMPEELVVQVPYVHAIVEAMGFPLVSIEGVEADDVLGTYAKQATAKGIKTVICTGDKDLSQLVDDNVILYDSMKDTFYNREGVIEKFGVPPELIIDFLALKGDSSDNIPGMPGVGDKTAVVLLNEIGGIDEICNHLESIESLSFRGSKTFAQKFRESLDSVKLSYELATIKTDVAVELSLEDLKFPRPEKQKLISVYRELEFRKYLEQAEKLPDEQYDSESDRCSSETEDSVAFSSDEVISIDNCRSLGSKFSIITTEQELENLCRRISEKKTVAVDTETTSLNPADCQIVGMSISVQEKEGFYIPLNHTYLGVPSLLSLDLIKEKLIPVLNGSDIKVIGHNLKFDLLVLHYKGIELVNSYADTMLMAHLLDSAEPVNMDDLAKRHLHYKTITYKELTGDSKKIQISELPVEKVGEYAAEDAEVTFRLYEHFSSVMTAEDSKLFYDIEIPFMKVLYQMEQTGVCVDRSELEKQNTALKLELVSLQKDIYVACGQEFNISSPKQLGKVLFDDLKIPYPKKAKDGKYSTAEDILEQISYQYDVANLVLRYRELSKLISTYTEKLQNMIRPSTGRIYTSFNQAGTVTGRLSSSDPNLQNIPARTNEGKLIRRAFVAPQGYSIVAADYSQIELRLIAHISQDPNLLKAFREGLDIHKSTAAEVLGKPISEVTPQERSHAKATNFGLMYGMGAFGLQRQTHMSMSEAKIYIERYFNRYPKVKSYMEGTKQFAHDHEYVTTITGRKISVANINSTNTMMAKASERAAINAPMQGGAADIIKLAMISLSRWIETLPKDTVRMTVQVHDELLFEVRNDFLDEAVEKIRCLMENSFKLDIPLTVGVGVSDNWAQAH